MCELGKRDLCLWAAHGGRPGSGCQYSLILDCEGLTFGDLALVTQMSPQHVLPVVTRETIRMYTVMHTATTHEPVEENGSNTVENLRNAYGH